MASSLNWPNPRPPREYPLEQSIRISKFVEAFNKNKIPINDDTFAKILQDGIPLPGLMTMFIQRAEECVKRKNGPDDIVRMRSFLYRRCFDIVRKQEDDLYTIAYWMDCNGYAKKSLWNVVLDAFEDAQRYTAAVSVLSKTELPVELQRKILDMAITSTMP
jgi:hypothetical protein